MASNHDQSEVITVDIRPYIGPAANLFAAIIIGTSLVISAGLLANAVRDANVAGAATTATSSSTTSSEDAVTTATTNIDDDAILGNPETAKVAIVEFSDYECPYCKRFRDETLDTLKEKYIDTGLAIFVYRDLPLSFHEPAASMSANATECAQAQAGSVGYFTVHDWIFANTGTNGVGYELDALIAAAPSLGLDGTALKSCIEAETYKTEIEKDASDATNIGINGTPGFVIGTLGADGSVTGEIITGAMPTAVFEQTIEKYL
jgi:protein-disulfide isomerase